MNGDIYDEVRDERERAHAKHGEKSIEAWPAADYARLAILTEEIGEVAKEFNEAELGDRDVDLSRLRVELIQVAAVAAAWADVIKSEQQYQAYAAANDPWAVPKPGGTS